MLIGIGESVATPTAMSILADRFPSPQLGTASGFYYLGVPVGVATSLLVAGYLGPALGWRACFWLLGGLGLGLSTSLTLLGETPRKGVPTHAGRAQPTTLREIVVLLARSLRRSPALCCTIAGGVAFHFILGAAAFDQLWLVQERGFERAEIARRSGWIGVIGGVIGNLLGGIMADAWQVTDFSERVFLLLGTMSTEDRSVLVFCINDTSF